MTDGEKQHVENIRNYVRDAFDCGDSGMRYNLSAIEQECRALLDLCQRCGERPADGSHIMCTDCWIATGEHA